MHARTTTTNSTASALAIGAILYAAFGGAPARAVVIDFETPAIATPNAELAGTSFLASGVRFRTVRLSGTVTIGGTITLTTQNEDLRIYRDASAISGVQLAGPSLGGSSNDLLMRFDAPLAALSLTTDDLVETANPIRLIALAETPTVDRYRVVDFVEGMDDAISAPANLLALTPTESFTLALFEVRSQQEAFDDLTYTYAAVQPPPIVVPPPTPTPSGPAAPTIPEPSSLALAAGALGAVAAARRRMRPAGADMR
jgi:MYXO-CTERM domain-containing protein